MGKVLLTLSIAFSVMMKRSPKTLAAKSAQTENSVHCIYSDVDAVAVEGVLYHNLDPVKDS